MKWVCDFETTTQETDCRVWAFGCFQIGSEDTFIYDNSLDKFMAWLATRHGDTCYFHNLKFDGEFILNWLFRNGFRHIQQRSPNDPKTFTTLISDKGMFYSLVIQFDEKTIVHIYDSLKILPFSVDRIAKGFGLPIQKLEIDYTEEREVGHILTEKEVNYLRNDVEIVAKALHVLFEQDLKKMTQGSNALYDYKKIVGKAFKKWFPIPSYDADIRQAYKGGFTYANPKFVGKDIGEGIVLDVNSLYPSRMYYELLPFGEGVHFEGRYQKDLDYPLYVQMITCNFELKKDHIPTIQLKNNLAFVPTEYVTSSEGEDITLCLTNVDLKLFLDHYDVYNIEFQGGWKFMGTTGMFKAYIDKWMAVKINASEEGNEAMRTLAKLMLNALYGKFALNPKVQSKIPVIEEGIVKYKLGEEEMRDPIYIPIGCFVTAYARNVTIRAAQKAFDRFLYADTDSLHLIGTSVPEGLEVDPVKLGAWKHESTFTRARFLRAKTYVEDIDGKLHVTCAGMPDRTKELVSWENFWYGNSFGGKLVPQHVPGGIVLRETEFTIKG